MYACKFARTTGCEKVSQFWCPTLIAKPPRFVQQGIHGSNCPVEREKVERERERAATIAGAGRERWGPRGVKMTQAIPP